MFGICLAEISRFWRSILRSLSSLRSFVAIEFFQGLEVSEAGFSDARKRDEL